MMLHAYILCLVGAILVAALAVALRSLAIVRNAFLGTAVGLMMTTLIGFPLTSYPLASSLGDPIPPLYVLGVFYPPGAWTKLLGALAGCAVGAGLGARSKITAHRSPKNDA